MTEKAKVPNKFKSARGAQFPLPLIAITTSRRLILDRDPAPPYADLEQMT